MKMVTDATGGADHPLHAQFCRELSKAVLPFTAESKRAAIQAAIKENSSYTQETAALAVVASNSKWGQKMNNYVEDPDVGCVRVQELFDDIQAHAGCGDHQVSIH